MKDDDLKNAQTQLLKNQRSADRRVLFHIKRIASKRLVWFGFICLITGQFVGAARMNYEINAIKDYYTGQAGPRYAERTPLHSALDTKTAKLLIDNGADVNARTKAGRTPLHNSDTLGIAQLLISKGADVNAQILYGRFKGLTPLDTADNADIADFLRKHGGKTGKEL
uniref:Uncharacterized protein n=1 Tax=uncultured organism MedDCM-OCT-S11-C29 TaxID=743658 RepID=D6PLC4_9ZZZZ|nr:hypothetical protein [uncultured organism MedDCM-OCT-S11-C29]